MRMRMGVPVGKEREKGAREISEGILAENFQKLITYVKIQIQVLKEQDKYKKCTPRYIILKHQKVNQKEKILKEDRVRGKHTYRGTRIRITLNFYSETMQTRRECSEIFKCWKKKNSWPILSSVSSEIILQNWRRNKDFFKQTKTIEFVVSRLALQGMLREILLVV